VLSLTPTKLRDFLTCPQQYKLRHVDRACADLNPAPLAFGRSLHAALEEVHRGDGGPQPADPEPLLRRHWEAGAYADERESEAHFTKGLDALRRYLDSPSASAEQILGTEVFMARVVNVRGLQIRLGCKADRVGLRPDGVLEITDYKTNASGRLPTQESLAADLPTFLYYVLARISYPQYPRVRVSFLNLLSLASVGVEYDTSQVAANKQALTAHVRTFADGLFEPRPGEACAWCPVQDHCPVYGEQIDFDNLV
jgi:putative RecB family exonuclease